ncbi:unnamed protein product [Larinioides sclopetarius]|uniref:Uncharacterized protein n=1 Tax=Larinioides sclopetarius TaxID=280406 RepID=A0AAV2BTL1_9ARAC
MRGVPMPEWSGLRRHRKWPFCMQVSSGILGTDLRHSCSRV